MTEALEVNGEMVVFGCPRCHAPAEQRFYGPCVSCREELGELMVRRGGEVVVEAYTPKLNVVANHVATKD